MRKPLLFTLLLWACPAWAGITVEQHNVKDNGSTASTTAAVSLGTVSAGDGIVCGVTFSTTGGQTLTNVRDNVNGAANYTLSVAVTNNSTLGQSMGVATFTNSASGTMTVTATFGVSGQFEAILCFALKGANISTLLDCAATGATGSTANAVSNACTTTTANDFIIGFEQSASSLFTAGSSCGGVACARVDTAATTLAADEDVTQTSTGSTTANWTGSAQQWIAEVVAVAPAPQASGVNKRQKLETTDPGGRR
jgi:hypothetical protein